MWKVVAYYTKNTIYEEYVKNLIRSLKQFNLPYKITPIDDCKDWDAATHFKPKFLRRTLDENPDHSIIYVDADAIFCRYPTLFDELDDSQWNIGAHVLDHSKYRRKNHPPELLSGTIFLQNTPETRIIIDRWISECDKDIKLWDQRALNNVLVGQPFYRLPEEYCVIFDYMKAVEDPVIKHFQASRIMRQQKQAMTTRRVQKSNVRPRKIVKGNIMRIRRANSY